jgi:hypothetical protein
MARYLIVPGFAGSGPDHWQSHWERDLPAATRVQMPDWHVPRRSNWIAALDQAVCASDEPVVLIAHSLGCVTVAFWAAHSTQPVRGALLVAPADLDRETCPPILREFGPMPRYPLRFASLVVASDDDPYAELDQVTQIARDWGSDLTVLHDAGHINSASGFGRWTAGHALLHRFDEVGHIGWRDSKEIDGEDPSWICRGVD